MVVRPGHPLLAASAVVQEVLRFPLVIYGEGTIPRHHTESFLSGLGLRLPAHVTQTLDLAVARALVAALGCGLVHAARAPPRDDARARACSSACRST